MYSTESDYYYDAFEKDETEIDELNVIIEKLKAEQEEAAKVSKERDTLLHNSESQRLKLQEKVTDQQSTISRLQQDIEEKAKRNNELHSEFLSMKHENKSLRDHLESLGSNQTDTTSKLEVLFI
jgi:chromosome segregation ATPase